MRRQCLREPAPWEPSHASREEMTDKVPSPSNELVGDTIPLLEEDGYFETEESWNEEMIKKWVKERVKTTWRAKIIDFIYVTCEAETLTTTDDSLPTTDSINLEVHLLKNTIKDHQIAAKADIED